MLEFSKIDRDFRVYRDNEVFLFGASKAGKRAKEIIEELGKISIKGFIDNNEEKCGKDFCGVNVISFSDFEKVYQKHDSNIIIQISSTFEKEILKQLEKSKIYNYISYSEFNVRLRLLERYLVSKGNQPLKEWLYKCDWYSDISLKMKELRDVYFERKALVGGDSFDIILSPPKTGNTTIMNSFKDEWESLFRLQHSYKYLDKELYNCVLREERMRMVIGVRDPIKQNISLMFQICENEFWDLDEFWDKGGDVQKIFDDYIIQDELHKKCGYSFLKKKIHYNYLVQDFFDQQVMPFLGIDIYTKEFDKKRGYSVYQFGNVEIFIYQLEKLNVVFSELAKFLGRESACMRLGNDAEMKWYNRYYKKAQKDIVLSKEYVETCYTGKYIKHFYSEEDIIKFRSIWKHNIK